VAPYDDDSGARKGWRHIARGLPSLSRAQYIAVISAIRSDDETDARKHRFDYRMRCLMLPLLIAMLISFAAIATQLWSVSIFAVGCLRRCTGPWLQRSCASGILLLMFALGANVPLPVFCAARNPFAAPLPGYKAVPVHYRPLNKMIMSVRINGHAANLLVDTGASQSILDKDAAESAGVKPFQRALSQVRFSVPSQVFTMGSEINGELLPVGLAQNISAGAMNFGSSPVALRNSSHSSTGTGHVEGVLGLDVLLRHKAVINCRTKLVFFKVDQARRINLASIASSEKFTRVAIQREANGALTVPCSLRGQPTQLLVDTGAFVTTLHEPFVKSLGIVPEPTRISAQFARGATKRINAAKIDDVNIGTFKALPQKFGVAALPNFALHQGNSKIAGILGMDTLYICHAIIDLDGMSLFLK
jgi:predicted aspartyl protease